MTLPQFCSEITVDWLNDVLAGTEIVAGGPITGFEREVIGEGVGFVGELNRLSLQFDQPSSGPKTLIAKLPTTDDMVRTLATLFGFYRREIHFYQDLAGRFELRIPKPYLSAMDSEESGPFVLLLEDLAPARCGDQLASCSQDEARLAITEIAKVHAAWWDSPRLDQVSWLDSLESAELRQQLLAIYQQSWPVFEQAFKDDLPPEFLDAGERFGAQFERLIEDVSTRPTTITHRDFRLDNMFFDVPGGGSSFALLDWQLVQRGIGVGDIAYFLAGNFPPDVRREHQDALLRHYHQALQQGGVTGYEFDQLVEDYRLSMLFLFLYIVPNREFFDMDKLNQRARDLINAIMERYSTAILDVGAADFLT